MSKSIGVHRLRGGGATFHTEERAEAKAQRYEVREKLSAKILLEDDEIGGGLYR